MPASDEGVRRTCEAQPHKFATPPDVAIATKAGRQHGAISAAQLSEIGLSRSAVRSRVRNGHLHRKHWGVYAVGHDALTLDGHFMAAVLAAGQARS